MSREWQEQRLAELVREIKDELEERNEELEEIEENGNPDEIDIEAERNEIRRRVWNVHEEAWERLCEEVF